MKCYHCHIWIDALDRTDDCVYAEDEDTWYCRNCYKIEEKGK